MLCDVYLCVYVDVIRIIEGPLAKSTRTLSSASDDNNNDKGGRKRTSRRSFSMQIGDMFKLNASNNPDDDDEEKDNDDDKETTLSGPSDDKKRLDNYKNEGSEDESEGSDNAGEASLADMLVSK